MDLQNHPWHYPQCCLQLVFEGADLLLQVLDFRFFDPQQNLWEQKRASLHLSRHSVACAVPSGNQAKGWRLSPMPAPQSLWSTILYFSQENSSCFSWELAQAYTADVLPAHLSFCPHCSAWIEPQGEAGAAEGRASVWLNVVRRSGPQNSRASCSPCQ